MSVHCPMPITRSPRVATSNVATGAAPKYASRNFEREREWVSAGCPLTKSLTISSISSRSSSRATLMANAALDARVMYEISVDASVPSRYDPLRDRHQPPVVEPRGAKRLASAAQALGGQRARAIDAEEGWIGRLRAGGVLARCL